MLPSIVARQVEKGLNDYLRNAFSVSTPGFNEIIQRFAENQENLFKGPYLTFDMPFRYGEVGRDYFPDVPLAFMPYRHQEHAFDRIGSAEHLSTIIATGTGSGKTECFTWPILDYCLQTSEDLGIKAILIYPLNALASDQASRLASVIWRNEQLNGKIRVGLYVDQEPDQPSATMTEKEVITSRDEIRKSPPNILITNYKMLDYMLIRPSDKTLWALNEPATLRFLVVDELHTFDGAQGTDLACLIRRLKERLQCPRSHLCCVGTSATLGLDDTSKLLTYASQVFGEPFDNESVVTEDRLSIAEYLLDKDVNVVRIPDKDEINTIIHGIDACSSEDLIRLAYKGWFGTEPNQDVSNSQWRVDLGVKLDGHVFLQSLLRAIKGKPVAYSDLREQLKGKSYFQGDDDSYLNDLIDTMTVLVSYAQRTEQEAYFNVRAQLWVRELRRLVANVSTIPNLQYSDDLNKELLQKHLPVIHCKDCGGTGWAAVNTLRGNCLIGVPRRVYEAYFGFSKHLRFVLREKPVRTVQQERLNNHEARICSDCLHVHDAVEEVSKCSFCSSKRSFVDVYIHRPEIQKGRKVSITHDCPYCGSSDGMGIVGAQSPTLLSAALSAIFASPHNEDRKLLAFSDSVQDAAHRAGFFEARSFGSVLRTALKKYVAETEKTITLDFVLDKFPASLRQQGDASFVATFMPQDLQWRRDYVSLLDSGMLAVDSNLPGNLEERLSFEAFAELTFRSLSGHSLVKAGLICVHPDMQPLQAAARSINERARDVLGDGFEHFSEEEWHSFLLGIIERMRQRGAVLTELTHDYLDRNASWFALLLTKGRKYKLPSLAPKAPRPTFLTTSSEEGYDKVPAASSAKNWYAVWAEKIFAQENLFVGARSHDLYLLAFECLVNSGLIRRLEKDHKHHNNYVWGLLPSTLNLWTETITLQCDHCRNKQHVPPTAERLWNGTPCMKLGCVGSFQPSDDTDKKAYFERVFDGAQIRRVVAREHTGLLNRETRTRIERGFMKTDQDPWDPNILSATSTLEMGIDVGDLSAVALCSVPPEQSNYIQRIGRSGRRSGNSLNLTIATGRSHDLYFWSDPLEMIAGSIKTPGVHLNAFEILKRQFVAYTLGRWISSTSSDLGAEYGKLRDCFENIRLGKMNVFPLSWYAYVENNVSDLLDGFRGMFPELTRDSKDKLGSDNALSRLEKFALGKAGDFTAWIADEFQQIKKERDDLLIQIKLSMNEYRRIRRIKPPPQDVEDQQSSLQMERNSLRELVKEIERKDALAFMTERGILPNYAFPEEGMRLKSVIYRPASRDTESETDVNVYEYTRPASAGLSEFAPPSRFYAEGHQVRIDELNLDVSKIEEFRLCPVCTNMKLVSGNEQDEPCPSCGSVEWRDNSQKRNLIRLRQVNAFTNARFARIGDDSDERKIRFFNRSLYPSFSKDAVEFSFSLVNALLPFGFEYIKNCDFREINFGEVRGDGHGSINVAGQYEHGEGFRICEKCGMMQGIHRRHKESKHKSRCPATDSDSDEHEKVAYLYREFPSEAIRFLMPINALDVDKGVQSFVSALNLGLRLHFEGKVDHLRTSLLQTSVETVTRRYLFLYDSVPGGTGYLRQLMTKTDDFRAIFEKALQHMQGCRCNNENHLLTDVPKDGCYRCLYAYRDASHMEKTSRSHAVSMFASILESWDSLETITSIDDIKGNALLESELEAMFVGRLEKMADDSSGIFRPITINGKKGYFLKLGKEAPAWEIEPQVWMNERFNIPVKTRADFLIRPKLSGKDLKPIAIYVDGWEHHFDKIGGDLEKRLAIIRTGQCLTWSLSYNDISKESAATSPQERVDHVWNPFSGVESNLGNNFSEKDCRDVMKLAESPSPKVLEKYLKGSLTTLWNNVPKILSLLTLVSPMSERQKNDISKRVTAAGGDELLDFMEDLGDNALLAMFSSDCFAFVAGIPKPLDLDKIQPLILVDDSGGNTLEAKKAWNTGLRLLNLLQFSPLVHAHSHSNTSISLPTEIGSLVPSLSSDWQDVYELVSGEFAGVLDTLRDNGIAPPVVGYELLEEDKVIAEAEFIWENAKIAVVYQEHQKAFQGSNWTVLGCKEVIKEPSVLLKVFKK